MYVYCSISSVQKKKIRIYLKTAVGSSISEIQDPPLRPLQQRLRLVRNLRIQWVYLIYIFYSFYAVLF